MELRLPLHLWQHRTPDWPAVVSAGLVGGGVLMVLELLWSNTGMVANPWRTSHLIAAIVLGPQALQSSGFSPSVVTVALLTHYVLGVVFAFALTMIIAGFHGESSASVQEVTALVFGSVLYLWNFHGMSLFFPWLADLQGWATYIGHLIFGMTVALTYPLLERRKKDL